MMKKAQAKKRLKSKETLKEWMRQKECYVTEAGFTKK
jgi:hypothetical protein